MMQPMTLDEISEYIGALHGETKPVGYFAEALRCEQWAERYRSRVRHDYLADAQLFARDASLLALTIRTLRNQGQPYYRV